jgi:hypothetical protein
MRSLLAIGVVILSSAWMPLESVAAPTTPEVQAPISREDVRQITQTLKSVSRHRITIIGSVRSQKWPFPLLTDTVNVWMSSDTITGDAYTMRKVAGKWTIVSKEQWIR